MKENIAIIGLGPAGISAAVQLHRCGVRADIYEPRKEPGLLMNANLVENYPGFPEGIPGPELMAAFLRQLDAYRPNIIRASVTSLSRDQGKFLIATGKAKKAYDRVILATGTEPMELDVPVAPCRLFYEVTEVPARFKRIAVIGGGDAAFDYALNLKGRGKSPVIICRGPAPKCLWLLFERAMEANIPVLLGIKVLRIKGKGPLDLQISTNATPMKVDCVLAAIGRRPALGMLEKGLAAKVQHGASVPGLYLAGDVHADHYRQVAIAAGDGLKAAMAVTEALS